jgi:hypothetical protein
MFYHFLQMIPINHPFVNQPQALKKPFPTCAETPAAQDSASATVFVTTGNGPSNGGEVGL